jgi:hypothetical protein
MWRINIMAIGKELLLMMEKGGMKESLKSRAAFVSFTKVTSAGVCVFTFDDRIRGTLSIQNGSGALKAEGEWH